MCFAFIYFSNRSCRKKRGIRHIELWSVKVQKQLDKYKPFHSRACCVPIIDCGDLSRYDISAANLSSAFSLVVCDDPSSSIKGGSSQSGPADEELIHQR
jgi:hypothetical protein